MKREILRTRSRWPIALIGALLTFALIPVAMGAVGTHKDLTTVTFMDDFTTNGSDSGYIVAGKPDGYLNKVGLQMQYSPGTGSGTTAQAVASGQYEFGEIATTALVNAVSQGSPIIALAKVTGQDGFGVVVTSDITSPAQLTGKTVVAASALLIPIFNAWLKAKNITGVNLVSVAPSALDSSVTSGAASGCLCVSFSDRIRINAAGTKTNFFPFAEVGLGFMGNIIITNTSMVRDHPDIVKKFLGAVLKGWQYSFDNPNLTAGILQSQVASQSPLASAQTNVTTLKAMKTLRTTPATAKKPYGWMSAVDWASAVKQMQIQGVLLSAPPSAAQLFTNAFNPVLPAAKKK